MNLRGIVRDFAPNQLSDYTVSFFREQKQQNGTMAIQAF
jgi:hypothetical protein